MAEIIVEEADCLEFALILSLLSRRTANFTFSFDINDAPEFIKLLSPGSSWKTVGRILKFIPGPLNGGRQKHSVCSIPDTLAPIIILSPFLAEDLVLELSGITNHSCQSVDLFKITYHTIFKGFQLPKFNIEIPKRGFGPHGEGRVIFRSKCVKRVDPIDFRETESILKLRGFVITSRIGFGFANRMISKIKNEMSELVNTKILCIVNNKHDSGPSPGYECSILGESKHGIFFATVNNRETPEKMAEQCCVELLQNIKHGRVFDRKLLPVVILLMGLADGTSYLTVENIDDKIQKTLDLLNRFLKVKYTVEKREDGNQLMITGIKYKNQFQTL